MPLSQVEGVVAGEDRLGAPGGGQVAGVDRLAVLYPRYAGDAKQPDGKAVARGSAQVLEGDVADGDVGDGGTTVVGVLRAVQVQPAIRDRVAQRCHAGVLDLPDLPAAGPALRDHRWPERAGSRRGQAVRGHL